MSTAGPDHARWADAAGAYLLGALAPGARKGFESHVEDCPVCRRDVDELQVVADALPDRVPPAEPPPALKARIMAIVEAEAGVAATSGERRRCSSPRSPTGLRRADKAPCDHRPDPLK